MPQATVAAIITQGNCPTKILLTRRNVEPFKDQWCLPGGHIEHCEPAQNAIVREVKEETNLDFSLQFFGYFDEIIPKYGQYTNASVEKPETNWFRRFLATLARLLRRKQDIHAVVLVFQGPGEGTSSSSNDEVKEMRWFPLKEAQTLPLAFTHNEILAAYATQHHIAMDDAESQDASQPDPKILLEEYATLRSEFLKRLEMRHQLLTFALVAAGTFITAATVSVLYLGPNNDSTFVEIVAPPVILLYPGFAYFLTMAWAQIDVRIGDIGEYVRENIEPKLAGMGWESYLRTRYAMPEHTEISRLAERSVGGIVAIAQSLTITCYLSAISASRLQITICTRVDYLCYFPNSCLHCIVQNTFPHADSEEKISLVGARSPRPLGFHPTGE